jgi:hypothetical protein
MLTSWTIKQCCCFREDVLVVSLGDWGTSNENATANTNNNNTADNTPESVSALLYGNQIANR